VSNLKAKYLLISYNGEGFITTHEMKEMLQKYGKMNVLEKDYNTFRGSRNLRSRNIHVKEYLFILKK
jgi:adenine-specific DNA-methyltransferase